MWHPRPWQWAGMWLVGLALIGWSASTQTTWPPERVIPVWFILTGLVAWQVVSRLKQGR
jgi:hypothetical protein